MLIDEKIKYGIKILFAFSRKKIFGSLAVLNVKPERKKKSGT